MGKHTHTNTGLQPSGQSDFGFISEIIDCTDLTALVEQLNHYRWTGRPGYPQDSMLKAFLIKHLLKIQFTRDLIAQLIASPALRHLCGFKDKIPHESTFSRFFNRLSNYADLIKEAIIHASTQVGTEIERLKTKGVIPAKFPKPGNSVAIDSSDVETYASTRRKPPKDLDARWGHRTAKHGVGSKSLDHDELFFGYKLHATCDAHYGTPLSWFIRPANDNDNPTFQPLFNQISREYPNLKVRYAIADRGYDSLANFQFLHQHRINAVIHTKRPGKEADYTVDGRPYCYGRQPMEYTRTEGKNHIFHCPPGGCDLKTNKPWLGQKCNDERHENWEKDNGLRIFGRLPKASPTWRRMFKKRTSIERMFGSLKQSRLLDQHQFLGIRKVRAHVALSLLTYSATIVAHLQRDDYHAMRKMTVHPPSGFQPMLTLAA